MSAWCGSSDRKRLPVTEIHFRFLYSALGFYSVNPASGEYVIGAPSTFDKITIDLPGRGKLIVDAPGASTKPYVRSLRINGRPWSSVVLPHPVLIQKVSDDRHPRRHQTQG